MAFAPDPGTAPRLTPFTVGDWLVEPKTCRVSRGDTVEKIRPQLADLLVCLARRSGTTVLRDEILAEVWCGQFVAESGLSRCIAELRQLLQDDAQQPRFIETIPKRGYRLIAPVTWLEPPENRDAPPASPPQPADRANGLPVESRRVQGLVEAADQPRRKAAWRRGAWVAAAAGLLAVGVAATSLLKRPPAGVLSDQDVVLLAFENRTGDAVFDATIPLAVSIQMEQTPYLRLLSPARVQETLRMMQRPPETPLTRVVATEVCERVGGRALIVTTIAPLGQKYAIGLEAIACGTGRVLARQQVTADRKERVLDGLQRAAIAIRRAVGEPAASLERYNVPIVEATTSSLEALRALRLGDVARERGQSDVALGHYRQALSLDPGFALAYSRLGTALQFAGTEADALAAFEKAYSLRQRVTVPERLEIEAVYHKIMTGEQAKVVEALELLKQTYPRRAVFRRQLAAEQLAIGQYDAALRESLEAQRLEPDSIMSLAIVSRAHLYSGRIAEAAEAAERALALGGSGPWFHLALYQCARETGDQELMAREKTWAARHPDASAYYFLETDAEEAINRGRLRESLDLLGQIETSATASGGPSTAAMLRLRMGRFEALAGRRAEAVRRIQAELRRGLPPPLRIDAVKVAVSAGDFGLATRLLDEIEATRGPGAAQPEATFVQAYRAAADAARGRVDQALALLAPLEPLDLGFAYGFIPLFERAKAHALAGHWALARAGFQKILDHPTIDSGRKLLPSAQLGLARTLASAGDVAGSRRTYEQLFERWKDADPDLPILLEARREYRALPE